MELTECKKTTEVVTKLQIIRVYLLALTKDQEVRTIKCVYLRGAIDVENPFHNCVRK